MATLIFLLICVMGEVFLVFALVSFAREAGRFSRQAASRDGVAKAVVKKITLHAPRECVEVQSDCLSKRGFLSPGWHRTNRTHDSAKAGVRSAVLEIAPKIDTAGQTKNADNATDRMSNHRAKNDRLASIGGTHRA